MESIVNSIKTLFSTYGFQAAMIVLLTIFFVNILKKPIIKYANKYSLKNNCDKTVITRYISILPFVIAFIIDLVWELAKVDFNFSSIDFQVLTTNVLLYGSLAVTTFEILKLQFEAYASKKQSKLIKEETQTEDVAIEKKQIEDVSVEKKQAEDIL